MIVDYGGHRMELLPERALWLPDARLLCVADLHLGKDSFFASFATFLPPYGSQETMDRLEALVARLGPQTVIAAGDSFHDRHAVSRMAPGIRQRLAELVRSVPVWHWLAGNHDPAPGDSLPGLPGTEWQVDPLVFRHQAASGDGYEISGHFHPKVRFRLRGHAFSLPCFVMHDRRLILPSFGQYTGGLDIDHEALLSAAPRDGRRIFAVHRDRVVHIDDKTIENLR